MTYKNIKFDESSIMRSLEKIAVKKGLIKPEEMTKVASAPKEDASLVPTENFEENILKLCSALRKSGYEKYAEEVESKFFVMKKAQYAVHDETGEDLINSAHPKGSAYLKGLEGEAVFTTVIDKQKALQHMVSRKPTGKQASLKAAADMVKLAGKLEKKNAINAVNIILAQNFIPGIKNIQNKQQGISKDEEIDNTKTFNPELIQTTHGILNGLLSNNSRVLGECVSNFDKIIPMMKHDKVPSAVRGAVSTYKNFVFNVMKAVHDGLNAAAKKSEEIEKLRMEASGLNSASKVDLGEVVSYLSSGELAGLGLGSAKSFDELKEKLSAAYKQIANSLYSKLYPAFDAAPFNGELKEMGNKVKEILNDSINTLNKG